MAGISAMSLVGCGRGSSSNGEANKTAAQILADAKAATSQASSLRVVGKIIEKGNQTQLDLAVGHGGGGGTVGVSYKTFQVVLHEPNLYVKADTATWTQLVTPTEAQMLAGKWTQTTTANPEFADLVSLLDASRLLTALSPQATLEKGATTSFHGASAIPLTDQAGNKGTLYVAATGPPHILGVTGGDGTGGSILSTTTVRLLPRPSRRGSSTSTRLNNPADPDSRSSSTSRRSAGRRPSG